MGHVVLLGDSIFDNARYVPGGPSVIEHLRRDLPAGWRATLLARDGAGTAEVGQQLSRLPADCTHLALSIGGNDALDHCNLILHESSDSFASVLSRMDEIRAQFQQDYRATLQHVLAQRKPTVVCTVYDSIPGLHRAERAGLCLFNDAILREAVRAGLPVIDLRLICHESTDYARTSPIEPSVTGGGKIARAVRRVATEFDFQNGGSRVFG